MSTGRCAVGWEYRTRVDRSPRPKFEVMCKTRFSQTSFMSIGPSTHLFASCRTVLRAAREVIRSARAVSLAKRKDA
jgi:hypothetical protein